VSEEHNCPRCNAPLLYFTGGNRNFQCCGYASQLQERIKRLEEAGNRAIENSYYPDRVKVWTEAKEAKP
jgi:transcription initiation factor IIE alpha subunit